MSLKLIALSTALGLVAAAAGATSAQAPAAPAAQAAQPQVVVSKGALKPIQELQAAVNAKDAAAVAAKLAAAQAAAKTAEDRYLIAQLQLKAAAATEDHAGARAAIEAMIASGVGGTARTVPIYLNLAKVHYNNKRYGEAASALERILSLDPGNSEAAIVLAETRNAQGRTQDAVALIQRAIQARSAGGAKAKEEWYKRAVGLAYDSKSPLAVDLSRQWVAAYPSPLSWRDALRIYRNMRKPDDASTLDILRLSRVTGALAGDNDFHLYAVTAIDDGAAGEAKAVLEEGATASQIDLSKPIFKEATAYAKARTGTGREGVDALAKEALAAPGARLAVRVAGALYGYGEYARAAELYRAALSKSGADADLINLRLGMALARAGDKAGATAAFQAVTGTRADVAKYWLIYLSTQA